MAGTTGHTTARPTARTTAGVVRGEGAGGVAVFRGIPYAAPPVGEHRFQPPRPVDAWEGERDATAFGPVAQQNPSPLESMLGSRTPVMSEDCLSLNVWTPAVDDGRRPVMVWIHGGAFVTGSGSTPWYDGTAFATHGDVVVVTLNYRLGVFGFLHLAGVDGDRFRASGNAGILDQVAALEWVRDNIEAFGGDPGNVTIFGESAGAMSVGTLLGLPAAEGLFQRAIAQSGAGHNAVTSEQASRITGRVLDELGLDAGEVGKLLELEPERLLEAQATVFAEAWEDGLAFQPVVDGEVLPQRPVDAVAGGSAADVALMLGTTADEMHLFTVLDPRLSDLDREKLVERCDAIFEGALSADTALEIYLKRREGLSPREIWSAIETDRVFRVPAIRLAEGHAGGGAATYMYLFTWATPAFGGMLGSCHALEIPFVFDNLDAPGVPVFTGGATDAARRLAAAMHGAWIAFARTGDPNHEGLPAWPRYDGERRATMVLGETIEVEDNAAGDSLHLWESVL